MALPHKPAKRRSRLLAALLASLGLHLLLLPWIAKDAVFHVPARAKRTLVGLVSTPNGQVQHAQQGVPSTTPSSGHSQDLSPKLPPPIADAEQPQTPQQFSGRVVSLDNPKDQQPPDMPT